MSPRTYDLKCGRRFELKMPCIFRIQPWERRWPGVNIGREEDQGGPSITNLKRLVKGGDGQGLGPWDTRITKSNWWLAHQVTILYTRSNSESWSNVSVRWGLIGNHSSAMTSIRTGRWSHEWNLTGESTWKNRGEHLGTYKQTAILRGWEKWYFWWDWNAFLRGWRRSYRTWED